LNLHKFSIEMRSSAARLLHGLVCSRMSLTRQSTRGADACVRADGQHFKRLLG